MTDDLVKRLREEAADWDEPKHSDEVDVRGMLHNAADRIEALTAENERLREAFGGLIEQCHAVEKELTEEYYGTHYSGESLPLCNARAALGKEITETFTRSDNV